MSEIKYKKYSLKSIFASLLALAIFFVQYRFEFEISSMQLALLFFIPLLLSAYGIKCGFEARWQIIKSPEREKLLADFGLILGFVVVALCIFVFGLFLLLAPLAGSRSW